MGTGPGEVKRGEVYWVQFPEPIGGRPAVILTRSSALARLTGITVGPTTTTERTNRSWVPVGINEGMPQDSFVNLDSIQTIDARALGAFICELPSERMAEVDAAIRFALELDKPPPL